MNRRAFLRFAAVAPVVAPVVVQAAVGPRFATGGVLRSEYFAVMAGEQCADHIWPNIHVSPSLAARGGHVSLTIGGARIVPDDSIVLAQMRDHDIFDFGFPDDDCFTNADSMVGKGGDA